MLERRFAAVQRASYQGPRQLRRVLNRIIPEYARLLEQTKAIDVRGEALDKAHQALVASLERQQAGLELALRGIEDEDNDTLARAGGELQRAQTLVERHRRLLAAARRPG